MSLETVIITPTIPGQQYRLSDGDHEFYLTYKQLLDLHNSLLHMFTRGGTQMDPDSESKQTGFKPSARLTDGDA
jgi:hypothetical protein